MVMKMVDISLLLALSANKEYNMMMMIIMMMVMKMLEMMISQYFTVSAIEVQIHIQVRLHDYRRGHKDMWRG